MEPIEVTIYELRFDVGMIGAREPVRITKSDM